MTAMSVISNRDTPDERLRVFVAHLIHLHDPTVARPGSHLACVADDIIQLEATIHALYNAPMSSREQDGCPSRPSWPVTVMAWYELFQQEATRPLAELLIVSFASSTANSLLAGVAGDGLARWGVTLAEACARLACLCEPLPRTIHSLLDRSTNRQRPSTIVEAQDAAWTLMDEVLWIVRRLEAQPGAIEIFDTMRADRPIQSDTRLFQVVDAAISLAAIVS